MPEWPKPVRFTTRLGPNFLWHMLAIARIGYDSDYADIYGHTVSASCLDVLHRHAPLLRFGDGESGGMTAFFTFLPGWLHIESRDDFERYFATLDQCLSQGAFRPLAEAFPHVDWSDRAFQHLPALTFPPEGDTAGAFKSLCAAYLASYDAYVQTVWPDATRAMAQRAAELSDWFGRRDYIHAWENALDIEFAAPSYEIVLCHSNRNGPDHNSLGYSGNLFHFNKPFDYMWQFASHEIGTHLLIDVMAAASQDGRAGSPKLYRAYEILAMFYNRRILGLDRLAYDLASYRAAKLLPLYEREHRTGVRPQDLLALAARDSDWDT